MSRAWNRSTIGSAAESDGSESEKLRGLDRWSWATVLWGAIALLVLVGIAVWGVARDFADIKSTILQAEINRLRSHAMRTTINLQDYLGQQPHAANVDWKDVANLNWLRRHWGNVIGMDRLRMYSAIISADGTVVVHSDRSYEGRHVSPRFVQLRSADDDDVTETNDPALTGGQRALDISLPIMLRDKQIGTYHAGLNIAGFDDLVRTTQRKAMLRWALVLAVAMAAGTAAAFSFYVVTRRITLVRQTIRLAEVRRLAELGQLVGAIAHEIRNPLNAMRLNLHVLLRWCRDSVRAGGPGGNGSAAPNAGTSDCEPGPLIEETTSQIHRIEELIRVLLAYARPEEARRQRVDLCNELPAIVDLLRQSLARNQVSIDLKLPCQPALVEIDPTRFRRIILNLVSNAKEASGAGGHVSIALVNERGHIDLEVCDDGPGVPDGDRERIFDPFYTTKELAAGLGLSLVKRFVVEAGGTVRCVPRAPHGACFQMQFTDASEQPNEPVVDRLHPPVPA